MTGDGSFNFCHGRRAPRRPWPLEEPIMQREQLSVAVAAVLALGAAGPAAAQKEKVAPLVYCAEQEKCYGVSRAGKNACSTSNAACAGSSVADGQKDAWVYLPKGMCEKLVGGSLAPLAVKK
jgi:uncharacterized membrane protein